MILCGMTVGRERNKRLVGSRDKKGMRWQVGHEYVCAIDRHVAVMTCARSWVTACSRAASVVYSARVCKGKDAWSGRVSFFGVAALTCVGRLGHKGLAPGVGQSCHNA